MPEVVAVAGLQHAHITVKQFANEGANPLVLFESSADTLEDRFVSELAEVLRRTDDFALVLECGAVTTSEAFYEVCRRTVPLADYMGSNLDALADIFRGEALSPNRGQRTYWVWTHADVLYESIPRDFIRLFDVLVSCARELTYGLKPYGSRFYPPRQRVTLVLTGEWGKLGEESSRPDSFLYHLSQPEVFPDDSTHVKAIRVAAT